MSSAKNSHINTTLSDLCNQTIDNHIYILRLVTKTNHNIDNYIYNLRKVIKTNLKSICIKYMKNFITL